MIVFHFGSITDKMLLLNTLELNIAKLNHLVLKIIIFLYNIFFLYDQNLLLYFTIILHLHIYVYDQ
jgi:hypothetical protein